MDQRALAAHLATRYEVVAAGLSELDVNVFRVDCGAGQRWVARVFPAEAVPNLRYVEGLLRRLETSGFPSERCPQVDAISEHDGEAVLLTEWVEGERSDGRGRTFGYLGSLLGALHSRSGESMPAGGAWHHLARGGPADEIAAAIDLMDSCEHTVRPEHHAMYDEIYAALHELDACADLPHCLVHPDFVPANAITTPTDSRVIVDWTGAGRGPRLWSLAFMLWAAGCRDLRLVEAAITRYASRVSLETDELARLVAVIPARPLTIDVWSFGRRRIALPKVVANLRANREVAERVSERVHSTLEQRDPQNS